MPITLDLSPDVTAELERLAGRYGSIEAAITSLVRVATDRHPQGSSVATENSSPDHEADDFDTSAPVPPGMVRVGIDGREIITREEQRKRIRQLLDQTNSTNPGFDDSRQSIYGDRGR